MKRSIALSCTSPRSALTPEYGSITPIFMFSARAGAASKSPSAAHPSIFHNRICILPGHVLLGRAGNESPRSLPTLNAWSRDRPIRCRHRAKREYHTNPAGFCCALLRCAGAHEHQRHDKCDRQAREIEAVRGPCAAGASSGNSQTPIQCCRNMRRSYAPGTPRLPSPSGALRKILHHRMGGVAEEGNPAVDPILDRIPIAEHPQPPVRAVPDDLLRALVHVLEALEHLRLGHRLAGQRLGRVLVICDNEIEDLPALQGIMHDMTLRPRP